MADFLTYKNLQDEIERALKLTKGSKTTFIKSVINQVYLNELLVCDDLFPLYWLVDHDDTLAAVGEMTITAISAADPGVITVSAAHGLSVNDIVSVYGIVGTTELNNRTYKVNSIPAVTTLSLIDLDEVDAIDTTSLTAYSSGGKILHRGRILNVTGKNVQRILQAGWHDEAPMKEITPEETEKVTRWWGSSEARPERYMLRKKYSAAGVESNQLLWFPGSDGAYDLRYWFEMRGARLSADADVPLLPPQFHDAIIAGAITRLAESNVQVENAVIWPGIYKAQIVALQNFNRKYWDSQKDRAKPYLL